MNKGKLNLVIDAAAACLIAGMAATGGVLWIALPPGTNRTHQVWGLLRHEWGLVHGSISVALLVVLLAHVLLHWRWLVTNVCNRAGLSAWQGRHPRRADAALGTLLFAAPALLVASAWVSARPLEGPVHAEAGRGGAGVAGSADAGHATLRDRAAGVLADRCARCHGPDDPDGGVRADTPEALLAPRGGVAWALAGDAGRSRVFDVIRDPSSADRRTRKGHVISADELDALRAWIDAQGR